jgi:hypothetical protein
MRMPGFTAEASIYRSCARYSGGPTSGLGKGEEGMIHPALPVRTFCVPSGELNGRLCCMVWDGGHYCWWVDGPGLASVLEGGQSRM